MTDRDLYPVGSQPPETYMGWHRWAAVQQRAGLRQRQCQTCGRWCFPQEIEDHKHFVGGGECVANWS